MSGGIILLSDLHLANRKAFGKQLLHPTYKGGNTRLHNILSYVEDVYKYAIANDCEGVAMLGDIFHERGVVHVPVYNALFALLSEYGPIMPTFIYPGNHDMVDSRALWGELGYNSLYCLSRSVSIIHTPVSVETDNFEMAMIPFNINAAMTANAAHKLSPVSKKSSMLLLHHSVTGAVSGPANWQMPHEIAVEDLPNTYNNIFSGHLHKHQTVKVKLTYVGAPLHHDLGERDYTPGFVHVMPDGTWKHVENTTSPRYAFIEAQTEKDLVGLKEDNFNVIVWTGDTATGEKLKENPDLLVDVQPEDRVLMKRTTISTTDSMLDMMRKFVNAKFGEDNPEVLNYGVNLYRGAE